MVAGYMCIGAWTPPVPRALRRTRPKGCYDMKDQSSRTKSTTAATNILIISKGIALLLEASGARLRGRQASAERIALWRA